MGLFGTEGAFESVGEMISTTGKIGADLLSLLMEPVYIAPEENPVEPSKRKKKKAKGKSQDYGISR